MERDDFKEILIIRPQIAEAVARLAEEISRDHRGMDLHLIGVLRGAVPFTCELMMAMERTVTLDFIGISSYGARSLSGVVRITKDLDDSIVDRHVLVVEGIVDTGLTLSYILRNLATRSPASLRVCAFLDKPVRRIIDVPVHYRGFKVPDEFVVGYGLDWRQRYRNLPFVASLKPEVLTRDEP